MPKPGLANRLKRCTKKTARKVQKLRTDLDICDPCRLLSHQQLCNEFTEEDFRLLHKIRYQRLKKLKKMRDMRRAQREAAAELYQTKRSRSLDSIDKRRKLCEAVDKALMNDGNASCEEVYKSAMPCQLPPGHCRPGCFHIKHKKCPRSESKQVLWKTECDVNEDCDFHPNWWKKTKRKSSHRKNHQTNSTDNKKRNQELCLNPDQQEKASRKFKKHKYCTCNRRH